MKVNDREMAFVIAANKRARTKRIARHGWPDFLLQEHDGTSFGVEVKRDVGDWLRPSQALTFAVLERAGIKVFVWSPDRPTQLRPWRKWRSQPTHHGRPMPNEKLGRQR